MKHPIFSGFVFSCLLTALLYIAASSEMEGVFIYAVRYIFAFFSVLFGNPHQPQILVSVTSVVVVFWLGLTGAIYLFNYQRKGRREP
jgi:hypothetical protein